VLSPACAQEIYIKEIGTEPEALIDGTHAGFYANLTNNGTMPALIDIDFKLDNVLVETKTNVTLGAGTSLRIQSDNSSIVSPDNKTITAVVYFNGKNLSKSKVINVNIRENPPAQEESGSFFRYLAIASAIVIITVIYFFVKTGRTQKESSIKEEISPQVASEQPRTQRQNLSDNLTNDFAFFLSDLKNKPEEYGQTEENRLMIAILESSSNLITNINKNNSEGSKMNLENIKRDTKTLVSRFKGAQIDVPAKVIQQPVITQQSINELKEELQRQRNELSSKKQFVDVLIPEYLLDSAEEKIRQEDIKAARGLISAAKNMLENEMVIHRLRKLKEIGF
jgi:hypothetical protein